MKREEVAALKARVEDGVPYRLLSLNIENPYFSDGDDGYYSAELQLLDRNSKFVTIVFNECIIERCELSPSHAYLYFTVFNEADWQWDGGFKKFSDYEDDTLILRARNIHMF